MLKLAYFVGKIQAFRVNKSRILTIRDVKLSGYYFFMNYNVHGDFQICISVPLSRIYQLTQIRDNNNYCGTCVNGGILMSFYLKLTLMQI